MEIKLDLPPRTVRMLKALKELNGFSAGEMGQLAAAILDKGLRMQISVEIATESKNATPSFIQAMESDLSMDLGDDEPAKGVTEDMLEHDLDIEDPRQEAKAEASSSYNEGAMNYLIGDSLDPRAIKRKKSIKGKGKVTPYTGNDSNEDSLFSL
jgi:hypothetical protein